MPTAINVSQLIEEFSDLFSGNIGPKNSLVKNIAPPHLAEKDSIVFLHNEKYLDQTKDCPANTLVVPQSLQSHFENGDRDRTVLFSHNPALCQALIGQKYFPALKNRVPFEGHKIHPTAVVAATAKVHPTVVIGPYAVVGENVAIGANSILGPQCTIETDSKIGESCHIHAQVYIGHSCEIGNEVEIHPHTTIGTEGFGYAHNKLGQHFRQPHYGRVIIEDRVHIGSNFSIDRGTFGDTVVRSGAKLDNHGHIAHNCEIGENSMLTGGFLVAGSTKIGKNFVCGGRTSVQGHVEISDNVTVAAMSVISGPIEKPGFYGGYPLMNYKDHLKALACIPGLYKMRKNLHSIGQLVKKWNK